MSAKDASSAPQREDAEKKIQRNPHPDFEKVQASRAPFPDDASRPFAWYQVPSPDWQPGSGATDPSWREHPIREIDPYEPGRESRLNYKLLISGIVPRFIGFLSTISNDGKANLAPFSYTTVVNHDPPVFCVGFAGGLENAKDTLQNLLENGECVINVIQEHILEAANATSVNAPHGISEWAVSGLTPAKTSVVRPARVAESGFAVECKLMETKEFESRGTPGKKTGVLAIVEGVRFHVREDLVNEEGSVIDLEKYKPVARNGGITYTRVRQAVETPRPEYSDIEAKVTPMGDDLKNKGSKGGLGL